MVGEVVIEKLEKNRDNHSMELGDFLVIRRQDIYRAIEAVVGAPTRHGSLKRRRDVGENWCRYNIVRMLDRERKTRAYGSLG